MFFAINRGIVLMHVIPAVLAGVLVVVGLAARRTSPCGCYDVPMRHLNPNALAFIGLGAVIGALAGSVLIGLAIPLGIVVFASIVN
jgi:hypothetical protein